VFPTGVAGFFTFTQLSTPTGLCSACGLRAVSHPIVRGGSYPHQVRTLNGRASGRYFSAVKVMVKFNHVNFTIIWACYLGALRRER